MTYQGCRCIACGLWADEAVLIGIWAYCPDCYWMISE